MYTPPKKAFTIISTPQYPHTPTRTPITSEPDVESPPSSQQPLTNRGSLLVPNQVLPLQPRLTQSPTPTPMVDPGSPVHILANKGITKNNKTNISTLATAMETFGDFKWPGTNTYAIGKEGALQLQAITKLLCEAATLYGDHRPVSHNEFQQVMQDLKTTLTPLTTSTLNNNQPSYAMIAKHGATTQSDTTPSRQKITTKMQDKQIFILLKVVPKDAPIHNWEPAITTRYCVDLISNHFVNSEDGPMELPLQGISKSAAGNITLNFKTVKDAT